MSLKIIILPHIFICLLSLFTIMIGKLSNLSRNTFKNTLIKSFASKPTTLPPPFHYEELIQLSPDTTTKFKKLSSDHVSTIDVDGTKFLKVAPEALRLLSSQAMSDIAHLLRPAHLEQVSKILKDPEATQNDKFVAMELLKNANIASKGILPGKIINHINHITNIFNFYILY